MVCVSISLFIALVYTLPSIANLNITTNTKSIKHTDIRFPEYALLLTQIHQCKILIYPGAFNLTTGPAHWELLQRARAVDGQCYVLTASPARMSPPKEEGKYPHYSAWGHSTVVSPWGEVVATTDEKPGIVIADLDMNKVNEMRMAIPTMVQKRHDLYKLVEGDGTRK